MAKLTVIRTKFFIGRLRDIAVYIDNQKEFKVSNGESLDIEIPPGEHTMRCKIGWMSESKDFPFAVMENGVKTVVIKPTIFSSLIFVAWAILYIGLRSVMLPLLHINIDVYFAICIAILAIGLFSIRGYYISIKDF